MIFSPVFFILWVKKSFLRSPAPLSECYRCDWKKRSSLLISSQIKTSLVWFLPWRRALFKLHPFCSRWCSLLWANGITACKWELITFNELHLRFDLQPFLITALIYFRKIISAFATSSNTLKGPSLKAPLYQRNYLWVSIVVKGRAGGEAARLWSIEMQK